MNDKVKMELASLMDYDLFKLLEMIDDRDSLVEFKQALRSILFNPPD
mgnify:CR=1 FL=1|jgi:hypothetical protein